MADWQKIQKNLPSKKFTLALGGCIALVLIVFAITSLVGSKSVFKEKNTSPNSAIAAGDITLNQLITQDSNDNGIPDWQESLYGLNPKNDGIANKKIIEMKQAAMNQTDAPTTDTNAPTDVSNDPTDQFTQSLLSTILALQQSGNLTEASIAQVAQSIGDTMDAQQTNLPSYTTSDMNISFDSSEDAKASYELAMENLADQYDQVNSGTELTLMAQDLQQGGKDSLKNLDPIATAYIDFSKKMLAVPTPKDVAPYALEVANDAVLMGQGLQKTETLYTDVLTGMTGLNQYVTASTNFDKDSANMAVYFSS